MSTPKPIRFRMCGRVILDRVNGGRVKSDGCPENDNCCTDERLSACKLYELREVKPRKAVKRGR